MDKFRIYLCLSVVTFLICATASASSSKLVRGSISSLHQRFANDEITAKQFTNALIKIKIMHGSHIDTGLDIDSMFLTAVSDGNLDTIKYLIEEKEMEIGDALLQAVSGGNLEVVRYLIEEEGGKIDRVEKIDLHNGDALMSEAVKGGHIEVAHYLLSNGYISNLDVDVLGGVLLLSARRGDIEATKFLVEDMGVGVDYACDDPNKIRMRSLGNTALYEAYINGQDEVAQYLLRNGADINRLRKVSPSFLLRVAISDGNLETVKYLIEEKEVEIGEALYHAVLRKRLEAVKYIIEQIEVEKEMEIGDALLNAVKEGHLEIVRYLIEKKGKKVDSAEFPDTEHRSDGVSLLHQSVSHGHVEVARYLLSKGANVHVNIHSGLFGFTSLHYAAMSGNVKMAELLISYGADVNTTVVETPDNTRRSWYSEEGTTPLHLALWVASEPTINEKKKLAMINLFVANGGRFNAIISN